MTKDPVKKKATAARYRARHPERIRTSAAQWRRDNPEKIRDWSARRRAANPEREKERVARWNAQNVERVKAQRRERISRYRARASALQLEWAKANPEKLREIQARYRRANRERGLILTAARKARRLAAPGLGITSADWRRILAESLGLCAYCNTCCQLTMDHIEALVHGGAHDVTNAAAACVSCNSSKGQRPLIVFLARRAALRSSAGATA